MTPILGIMASGITKSKLVSDLAVVHNNSPYVTAYPWSAGFGTKYANPSTLPGGLSYGVAFKPQGDAIAVGGYNSPYVTAYPWAAGFGSKYSNPATLPPANSFGVAFQ